MAFNASDIITGVNKYIDQLSIKDIQIETVLEGHTKKLVTLLPNVKYQMAIPNITSNLVVTQTNCSFFSPTGSVTLTYATMTTSPLSVLEAICLNGPNTLEQYFTAYLGSGMPAGSYYDSLTPEAYSRAYCNDKMNKLQDFLEQIVWKGSNGTPYGTSVYDMTQCNGFLYLFEQTSYSGSVNTGTFSLSSFQTIQPQFSTQSGAFDITDSFFTGIPTNISNREDLSCFMSVTQYRRYIQSARNKNFNNLDYQIIIDKMGNATTVDWGVRHNGSNMWVYGISGLQSVDNKILTGPAKYLYIGFDLESDIENFKMTWENLINSIVFRANFKIGVQALYPQYFTLYTGE